MFLTLNIKSCFKKGFSIWSIKSENLPRKENGSSFGPNLFLTLNKKTYIFSKCFLFTGTVPADNLFKKRKHIRSCSEITSSTLWWSQPIILDEIKSMALPCIYQLAWIAGWIGKVILNMHLFCFLNTVCVLNK